MKMEEARLWHEIELCGERNVKCDWRNCVATMKAKDRAKHRQRHLDGESDGCQMPSLW